MPAMLMRNEEVDMSRRFAIVVALGLAFSHADRVEAGYLYTTLTPPDADNGYAYGINDKGDVVGNYVSGGASNGFLLSKGIYTPISYRLLTGTSAAGINNAGSVVGFYYNIFDSNPGGFKQIGGQITGLEIPDSKYTQAWGINSQGQIVGLYEGRTGGQHGFLIDGPNFIRIDFLFGSATNAFGINDLGQIVGTYLGEDDNYHGFLLSGGNYTMIDVPDAVSTYAQGINQLGDVVGYYEDSAGLNHGFLYSSNTFTTLDAPDATGGTYAYGINSRGEIVGGYYGASGAQPFLATAVPEPASLLLLATGAGLLLAACPQLRGRRVK
jgi:probable HAF family extracellular repeat protein